MKTKTDEIPMPTFGLLVIGDEILSGRRVDKHLVKCIELLSARQLSLGWAEYLGDDPQRLTDTLRRVFATSDVVFSTGGIGATPDDYTRQCAAAALDQPLQLHPEAKRLIQDRLRRVAEQEGQPWEPDRSDNLHRLNMGVFPQSARIIPNPFNQIPGFSCSGPGGGAVHFMPGFPVMAWPMMEWLLDTVYLPRLRPVAWQERSVVVYEAAEAALTPLMVQIERDHPRVKVFSLPSVDHPEHGRHIDLGVKGEPQWVGPAFADLKAGLQPFGLRLGPELVRP